MTDHDARAIAEQLVEMSKRGGVPTLDDTDVEPIIAAALRAAHQAGLEEAAKIAETAAGWLTLRSDEMREEIASGIRARAEEHKANG